MLSWKEVKLQEQVTFICASCCCCCCCCSRRKASCCCCLCLMISFWRWSSSSLRFRSSSSSRCRAASSSMRSRLSSSRRWASSSSRAHLAASSSFPGHRIRNKVWGDFAEFKIPLTLWHWYSDRTERDCVISNPCCLGLFTFTFLSNKGI